MLFHLIAEKGMAETSDDDNLIDIQKRLNKYKTSKPTMKYSFKKSAFTGLGKPKLATSTAIPMKKCAAITSNHSFVTSSKYLSSTAMNEKKNKPSSTAVRPSETFKGLPSF